MNTKSNKRGRRVTEENVGSKGAATDKTRLLSGGGCHYVFSRVLSSLYIRHTHKTHTSESETEAVLGGTKGFQ